MRLSPLYLVASVVFSFSQPSASASLRSNSYSATVALERAPLAFVVLVAVGADYNMLFMSRMRDESPHSMRYGVIRTLTSTGGVITATALIFAASMSGLLFSSIGIVVQGGFIIAVGILLDTLVVRARRAGARHRRTARQGELVAVTAEDAPGASGAR